MVLVCPFGAVIVFHLFCRRGVVVSVVTHISRKDSPLQMLLALTNQATLSPRGRLHEEGGNRRTLSRAN